MIDGVQRESFQVDLARLNEGLADFVSPLVLPHAKGNVVDLAAVGELDHRCAIRLGGFGNDQGGQALAEVAKAFSKGEELPLAVELERGAAVEASSQVSRARVRGQLRGV